MKWFSHIFLTSLFISLAAANVEKIIFVAPEAESFPSDASLDNLLLERVTLAKPSLRTHINASFPTQDQPKGTQTWMMLEDLTPSQRYEVRICWLATQPTSFWLHTHRLQATFEDPELISALTTFSNHKHSSVSPEILDEAQSQTNSRRVSSMPTTFLFLQIFAAADYFSLNKTLMENVPPVHVDVILDPYLLNIFPQSLLPTAGYITTIAVLGWFLSSWIYRSFVLPFSHAEIMQESKKTD